MLVAMPCNKVFMHLAILTIFLLCFGQVSLAQRVGPAAKGGSLSRERVGEKPSGNVDERTLALKRTKYKKILTILGIPFDEVQHEYDRAIVKALEPKLEFKRVILAALAVRNLKGSHPDITIGALIEGPRRSKSLENVLRGFNLSKEMSKALAEQVTQEFVQAEKEANASP
jgi:CO/xanthine dehydrogenase FAD-binding subunit